MEDGRMTLISPLLEAWYREKARPLPWRLARTPYGIWISEIMLQQTRIEAVTEKYRLFTERFPDIPALAEAEEQEVLKLWEGLGYYSRARHLHAAAKLCCERHGGRLPEHYAELRKLPGIGSYTAGAIASIAFGENVPAVDGNVLRVLSRVLADERNVLDEAVREEAGERIRALQKTDPGLLNEALMELGETVCLPNGEPLCGSCPLKEHCLAAAQGRTGELPVRVKKTERIVKHYTVIRFRCGGRYALEKRPAGGLLSCMYGFPMLEEDGRPLEYRLRERYPGLESCRLLELRPLGSAKHIFTHREWRMEGCEAVTERPLSELIYVTEAERETSFPLPSAFRYFLPERDGNTP